MKKLYEKNELTFAIVWIVIYCFLQSLANSFNETIGTAYAASAVFCILQTVVLIVFIRKNDLSKQYGLCRPSFPAGRFLYYVPLLVLATGNLWNGIAVHDTPAGTVCRIVCMLCVGFIEELIFRGFLFKAIAKESIKRAIVISSVTFGIGHMINLINGSGMHLLENLFQVIFAIAIGFLFVMLFHRGGSLLPCIITHSAINSLNTFSNKAGRTTEKQVVHCLFMIAVTIAYTLILTKMLPDSQNAARGDDCPKSS